MLTAQALAICIFAAAKTYAVPVDVVLGIMHVEGGRVGQMVRNTNGSHDLGPMQINTLWIPELARHWKLSEDATLRLVRDDACVNVGVGAWILRGKIDHTGSLMGGIAGYHSLTPHLGQSYRRKVLQAMQHYKYVREPQDLLVAVQQKQAARNKRRG